MMMTPGGSGVAGVCPPPVPKGGRLAMDVSELRAKIRDIKDFPTEGILFKDITTLLKDPKAFKCVLDELATRYIQAGVEIVVGVESRGFIFGGALAHELGAGFVPVRKLGKLPAKTIEVEYELEYGRDALAIHEDAIGPGQRVLVVDDLLATGGTMAATLRLVEQCGGIVVGLAFLIELAFLHGRAKLKDYPVTSLIVYE
jgi:adenine phosphoribosyltransferase